MSEYQKAGKSLKLFVPGRLCLFGEHSDWAGMHRMVNADVEPGYAIVSGIEEGIYVLTSAVFEELESNIRNGRTMRGEYQLTDALEQVREKHGLCGYKPNGKSFDLGLPEAYRRTMWEFRKQ